MNTQKLFSISAIFLLVILTISAVSALSLNPSTVTLNQATQNQTVTLTDINNVGMVDFTLPSTNEIDGNAVTFKTISSINASNQQTITVGVNNIPSGLKFGKYSSTLTAIGHNSSGDNIANATSTVEFFKSFCRIGAVGGNLSIENVEIESNGDDDEEWRVFDEITVTVEVENIGDDDIDEVFVELGLYDSNGKNVISDVIFINSEEEEIELGDLKDGKSEEVEFKFRIPADLDEGDYKVAVKAYSDDLGESNECDDSASDLDNRFYHSVSVEREDDEGKFIAIDNVEVRPDQLTCGDSVTLSADVFNVGNEDQDQVRIVLVSEDLNVDLSREIRDDLDEGDDTTVQFSFVIPQVNDGTYTLELFSEYDYRSGVYRERSDRTERFPIEVIGCDVQNGPTTGKAALITPTLDSDANAGSQMIVTTTITNLLSTQETFVVRATGFEAWATLDSISEPIFSLAAGESKQIRMVLNVDEDASGRQSFTIEARAGSKIETKNVEVDVEKSGFDFDFGNNTLIWIIAAINIVLILLIVLVAVRIARR